MSDDIAGLFAPFRMGGNTLANRFVMPGMQRGWCEAGRPLPQLADYYRKRVEGGVSLVISESCAIAHPTATAQPAAARLAADTRDAWAHCIAAVVEAGGHMLLQLWHEGGLRKDEDGLTISASGYGHPGLQRGRSASTVELGELIDSYIASARLAQDAGAAGVEVHGAHGFMLDQFLWAATNRRVDGYGGPAIADRVRLPAEIVAAIRAECGPDFLISFRFSQWKEHDYTARVADSPDELGEMLTILRKAGVDVFHASTRRFWEPEWPDHDWGLAGWTRHLSGLPTITVGSVGLDRDVMESFSVEGEARPTIETSLAELARRLAGGEFDLVSVGRSLISDPDWVNKVRAGDYAAIRPFRKSDIATLEWEG